MKTVSILVPHLGRDEGLDRLLDSIMRQTYPAALIEVLVDKDPEPTVPQKVKAMAEKATGDCLMYAANDLELMPDCIEEAMKYIDAGWKLVALNDSELLPDRGNACAHFIISRELLPELENGEIFSTDFTHVGCDNWLMAQAEKLGTFIRCTDAEAVHHHFTKDSAYDWVYERGWKHAEADRETLKKKLATL